MSAQKYSLFPTRWLLIAAGLVVSSVLMMACESLDPDNPQGPPATEVPNYDLELTAMEVDWDPSLGNIPTQLDKKFFVMVEAKVSFKDERDLAGHEVNFECDWGGCGFYKLINGVFVPTALNQYTDADGTVTVYVSTGYAPGRHKIRASYGAIRRTHELVVGGTEEIFTKWDFDSDTVVGDGVTSFRFRSGLYFTGTDDRGTVEAKVQGVSTYYNIISGVDQKGCFVLGCGVNNSFPENDTGWSNFLQAPVLEDGEISRQIFLTSSSRSDFMNPTVTYLDYLPVTVENIDFEIFAVSNTEFRFEAKGALTRTPVSNLTVEVELADVDEGFEVSPTQVKTDDLGQAFFRISTTGEDTAEDRVGNLIFTVEVGGTRNCCSSPDNVTYTINQRVSIQQIRVSATAPNAPISTNNSGTLTRTVTVSVTDVLGEPLQNALVVVNKFGAEGGDLVENTNPTDCVNDFDPANIPPCTDDESCQIFCTNASGQFTFDFVIASFPGVTNYTIVAYPNPIGNADIANLQGEASFSVTFVDN